MQIQSRSADSHGFNHHLPAGGLHPHVTLRPIGDVALDCRDNGNDLRVTLAPEDVAAVIWCALSDYAFRAQIREKFKHLKSSPFEIVERRAPEPTPQRWPIPQPERRAYIAQRPIEPAKGSLLPKMPVPDHCRRDDQTVKPMAAEFA